MVVIDKGGESESGDDDAGKGANGDMGNERGGNAQRRGERGLGQVSNRVQAGCNARVTSVAGSGLGLGVV